MYYNHYVFRQRTRRKKFLCWVLTNITQV
jgi:hypothetical protein